jgi:signal transduction histidine kinase
MLSRLYVKLVAVLVGFALIMAAAFVLVIRYSDNARRLEMSQRVYRTLAADFVRETVVPLSGDSTDYALFSEIFNRIKVINPRIDAYLVDATGAILAASERSGASRRDRRVNPGPIREFLSEGPTLPILGDDPTDPKVKRAFSAARVELPGHREAYLYLVLRGTRTESIAQPILQSYTLRQNLMVFGGALVLALIAAAIVIGIMTRRLKHLARVVDRFRESGFAEQPAPGRRRPAAGDEIDQLAGTFSEMADRILDQMRELRQSDSTRRELVANISHDLRTPLASLQGYLETLQMKGDRLSPEEQRNYLEIALRQSERLSQLVAQLFELAKLDAGRAAMAPEPFVLTDLVQDVVQEFELAATGKGIRLSANLPLEMPLVHADIGLIERALHNLIENSLRYTPAGGLITVSVVPGDAQATVQVADTGSGIDAEDLPRIFDRFYRGEKSRSGSSANAGLGLAITKRILELHESVISVASEPGRTRLEFTLPYVGSRPADAAGSAQAVADAGSTAIPALDPALKARSAAG